MRRIERHQRREAIAPVGNIFQRLAVGGLIGVVDGEFGAHRARIGERQADGEPGAGGDLIDGIEQQRVVVLGNDDAGEFNLRVVAGKLPLDAVDGQAWQPEAEDTPTVR